MAKLYPPTISGIIPAFSGGTITVPFSMNRAVSKSEVGGFSLKIKTISNDTIDTIITRGNINSIVAKQYVNFSISENKVTLGQFYKLQLAYIDINNEIGHYSTVGVVKCTIKPTIKIEGLSVVSVNPHQYDYVLIYTGSAQDPTEKLYNYRWIFRDENDQILIDSGVKLHNITLDDSAIMAIEQYSIARDLEEDKIYTIQCYATTTNGIELKTPKYQLQQRHSVMSEIDVDFTATLDYDNGLIRLTFSRSSTPAISGNFLLSRKNIENNIWEPLRRLDFHNILYTSWEYIDYTIEQGKYYYYSLQQYNENNVYSERILSNLIYGDFEDSFLFDGTKQLCVRYNPKVSTYKRDIPESKVDTIGSKYPFFTRNGNVNYKEFALSGLISYQMDPDSMYMDQTSLKYDDYKSDLVSANVNAEREFKNDILDWLNDGGVKLLRTPAEGNYLVRLMNVSFSPIDTLGRMLHNFSCNAYEIDEISNDALNRYGIIDTSENLTSQTRWASVELRNLPTGWQPISTREALSISVVDMIPESKIRLTFENGESEEIAIGITGAFKFEGTKIALIEAFITHEQMPGIITYSYNTAQVSTFGSIDKVKYFDVICRQYIGRTYQFTKRTWETHIITAEDIANRNTLIPEINRTMMAGKTQGVNVPWLREEVIENILDDISDEKIQVSHLYYLRAKAREVRTIYVKSEVNIQSVLEDYAGKNATEYSNAAGLGITFYKDRDCRQPITSLSNYLERIYLYEIREVRHGIDENGNVVDYSSAADFNTKKNSGYYVDAMPDEFYPLTNYMIEGASNWNNELFGEGNNINDDSNKLIFKREKDLFSFVINGTENIDIEDHIIGYYLVDCSSLKSVVPNHGVILEIGYEATEKLFTFEREGSTSTFKKYKDAYDKTRNTFLENRKTANAETKYPAYKYSPAGVPQYSGTYNSDRIVGVIATRYHEMLTELTLTLVNIKLKGGEID